MYIRYLLKNVEPLRITDGSTSQNGQIDTLTFIPGTTMRGVIINRLAEKWEKTAEWKEIRRTLFSNQVSYLNAYPMGQRDGTQVELLPSPKGFYEDKVKQKRKKIQNVLQNGKINGDYKRAALGKYCCMEGENIWFTGVELGSDMRISTGNSGEQEKNMFRSQYIIRNQMFCGYIAVKDKEICDLIKTVLEQNYLLIGNARFAGMGKCEIVNVEVTEKIPYENYSIQEEKEQDCYLYLVSNTVMCRENGEPAGLDIPTLQKLLGVEELKVELCATSTVKNNGYSRIWKARLPEAVMYEMGSVFKLSYKGILKKERADAVLADGIGIRKNEGFGRVLILRGYEALQYKQKLTNKYSDPVKASDSELTAEDRQVLQIAAKGYYLEKLEQAKKDYLIRQKDNPILNRTLPPSQMGTIESYAASLKYVPNQAKKELQRYLEHAVKRDERQSIHGKRQKRNEIKEFIDNLLETDLEEFLDKEKKVIGIEKKTKIMGIEKEQLMTKEEILKWKLQFLVDMIRYANREGKSDGETGAV